MIKTTKYKFSEVPERYWDFVQRCGSIYQTRPFLECMVASGKDIFILEITDHDTVVGGSCIIRHGKFLNFTTAATTFFGPVVSDIQKYDEVFHCYTNAIKSISLMFGLTVLPAHAEAICISRDFARWSCEKYQTLHWDISGSVERMLEQLPKGKRAVIKRAQREGVIIEEIITPEQIREFYHLYDYSMSRGKVSPQPLVVFENMIKMLRPKGLAAGFLALHPTTKQPIASVMLLLGTHGEAIYMAVGQDYEFRALGATDLLVLHCVEFLKSRGFVLFDMVGLPPGNSPRAQGIRHFKLAWVGDKGLVHNSYILTMGFWGIKFKTVVKKLSVLRDRAFFFKITDRRPWIGDGSRLNLYIDSGLIRRAQNYYVRHKLIETIKKILAHFVSFIFSYRPIVLYQCSTIPDVRIEPLCPLKICKSNKNNIESIISLMSGVERSMAMKLIEEAFAQRGELFLAYSKGKIVHVSWLFHPPMVIEALLNIKLQPDEAHIGSCRTDIAFRGKYIYPAVLQYILREALGKGFRKVYVATTPYNFASAKGILRAGFKRLKKINGFMIMGRMYNCTWSSPPSAEPIEKKQK